MSSCWYGVRVVGLGPTIALALMSTIQVSRCHPSISSLTSPVDCLEEIWCRVLDILDLFTRIRIWSRNLRKEHQSSLNILYKEARYKDAKYVKTGIDPIFHVMSPWMRIDPRIHESMTVSDYLSLITFDAAKTTLERECATNVHTSLSN